MISRLFYPPLNVAALLLALVVTASQPAQAQETAQPQADAGQLPLEKLVLFSSGVGFFEHRGNVQGDAAVNLRFNVRDINDLLKSMVLQDLGGGRISTVTYGSKDPITKTLQTFAVDLTSNPSLGDILNQLRGERVELDAQNPVTGVILGVETREKPAGKEGAKIEVEFLNVLADEGMRSIALENIGRIKLLNEKLDAELRQALKVLATGHATDKKTVSLSFAGEGKRPVRVGYIQETPIWKTSYRLVLSEKEQPFLQGWAIVENTTEHDWKDVSLTLISGRPISYVMNLYDPLYVKRPVVEPELFASLRPQTYGQDMAAAQEEFANVANSIDGGQMSGRGGDRKRGLARAASAAPAAPSLGLSLNGSVSGDADGNEAIPDFTANLELSVGKSVQSVAQAANVGELFQYVIATPVTLPRQQSAMLPIVNDSVKGKKVSIYNPAVHAKHPLNGLKVTNSTDLHLMQGPITVFDAGAYAGDARIEDLPPGSERLISYAMDLDTEVAPEAESHPNQLLSVRLEKGVLLITNKYERGTNYTVKNSSKKPKDVLIEYAHDANWKLVEPKDPAEKTRNLYRFAVTAEPGKPAKLAVKEERIQHQHLALTNLDDSMIVFYMKQKTVSPQIKEALADVVKRKSQIERLVQERQQHEQRINAIAQDQNRIRQNMGQIDRNADLYKRYMKTLNKEEDELETLRDQIAGLLKQETSLRASLNDYLANLTI